MMALTGGTKPTPNKKQQDTKSAADFYEGKVNDLGANIKDLEVIVQNKTNNLRVVEEGTSPMPHGHISPFSFPFEGCYLRHTGMENYHHLLGLSHACNMHFLTICPFDSSELLTIVLHYSHDIHILTPSPLVLRQKVLAAGTGPGAGAQGQTA